MSPLTGLAAQSAEYTVCLTNFGLRTLESWGNKARMLMKTKDKDKKSRSSEVVELRS